MRQVSNILKSVSYAVLSVVSGLFTLLLVLFRIDETPIEGSPAGAMMVLGSLLLVAVAVFFAFHRLFFGPLTGLRPGFDGHLTRAWAAYVLVLVGMLVSLVGITPEGPVIVTGKSVLEMLWSGPVLLALIPIVVDGLRVLTARVLRVERKTT